MNRLRGQISAIESCGQLSLVDVDVAGGTMTAIVVETPQSAFYLKIGGDVWILFKETEVSLAKDLSGHLSLRNRLKCVVRKINKGQLLCEVHLDYKCFSLVSIITRRAVERLALSVGDRVEALIKANEVMFRESSDAL